MSSRLYEWLDTRPNLTSLEHTLPILVERAGSMCSVLPPSFCSVSKRRRALWRLGRDGGDRTASASTAPISKDPQSVSPRSIMPKFLLSDKDITDLTQLYAESQKADYEGRHHVAADS